MKQKVTGDIWADIRYQITNSILQQVFINPKLNFTVTNTAEIVYHYTSLDNFLAILKNQSLFFTNLNYLNDSKEYKYGVNLIHEIVEKYEKTNKNIKILEEVLGNIQLIYKSQRYISCFSSNGDLLSQWRAYGNHGKGIAMGFTVSELDEFESSYISAKYIQYNENEQRSSIEEIITIILNCLDEIKDIYEWTPNTYEYFVAVFIIEFLEEMISTFKHPSFIEEKEFRLEYTIDGNINKLDKNKIEYRSNQNFIIPYNNIRYIRESNEQESNKNIIQRKLPVKKIIIGPSLDFDLNKVAVESFLLKLGYTDFEIIKSNVPYRI